MDLQSEILAAEQQLERDIRALEHSYTDPRAGEHSQEFWEEEARRSREHLLALREQAKSVSSSPCP